MNQPDAAESKYNPYRGVVIFLFAAALAGTVGALAAGIKLDNPVLYAVAITLGISTGVLAGVVTALILRGRPPKSEPELAPPAPVEEVEIIDTAPSSPEGMPPPLQESETTPEQPESIPVPNRKLPQWAEVVLRGSIRGGLQQSGLRIGKWLRDHGPVGVVRIGTAVVGAIAILDVLWRGLPMTAPTSPMAGIEAAIALVAAGLVATALRYLSGIDSTALPESQGLVRGARIVAWTLVLAAFSAGLSRLSQWTILQILFYLILAINAALCYGLLTARRPPDEVDETFPLNIAVLSVLGSRTNILASVQDAAEAQLGIDLRSTWALTVVRRGLEPLVIGLCLVGWLSTSVTAVGPDEQGLVERSGVSLPGPPLEPGLHLHLPWPIDRVFRIPVKRVQELTVGHEGEEAGGPENVLWAYKHAENEYTLLLGNGRDLLTVDAGVQFRIADARAWLYHSQNPAVALKALAYRAVTRSIVGRTLADALSENVAVWTGEMKAQVQSDADALGLGVEVLGFTVGGMHPPVNVATDYQAVVSAELRKVTTVVIAQAYRNKILPDAEAAVLRGTNVARSDAANSLALAAGGAWSFRALEAQFHASPEEFYFRRRLETLEKALPASAYTVVDTRFQREGGELWVIP